jgi:hypothetical protein
MEWPQTGIVTSTGTVHFSGLCTLSSTCAYQKRQRMFLSWHISCTLLTDIIFAAQKAWKWWASTIAIKQGGIENLPNKQATQDSNTGPSR